MKQSGIVFDFNGTLFLDSDINEWSWTRFLRDNFSIDTDREELVRHMHGFNSRDTLEYFLKREISEGELFEYTVNGKEKLYKQFILDHPERQRLTAGAEDLLNRLKEHQFPMTIATASDRWNLEFFTDLFGLERWFDPEIIVYNDGNLPGKPAPDIYLKSFRNLSLKPEECIVFEDAPSGILAARRAKAGRIIGVDAEGQSKLGGFQPDQIISDFSEFDTGQINL